MATRTVSNAGGNWNSTSTWVEGAVPTTADDVVFTATSGNLTINATANCKSINFSNWLGTLTFGLFNIIAVNNINLGTGGYTIIPTINFGIAISGTGTLTPNGVIWTCSFATLSTSVITLASDFYVTGSAFLNGGIINSNNLYLNRSLSNNVTQNATGTATIIINGTGTLSSSNTGSISNNLIINTTGTTTIGSTFRYNGGTLTYSAGTVITTGGTLATGAFGTTTLNTDGINWSTVSMGGNSNIVILTSPLRCSTFTSSSVTINTSNGSYLYTGNFTNSSSSGSILGTSKIILNRTGTWQNTGTQATLIDLDINSTGTTTLGTTIIYQGGTLTYLSGTINTGTNTIFSQASTTWNTSGMSWNNVTIIGGTHTLISDLNINGNFTTSNPITYNGSNINLFGSLSINQATSGTANFIFKGTGTWSNAGVIGNPFIINSTGGTLTCSGTIAASNITYSAGIVNTSGSTFGGGNATNIWNTNGITWNNVVAGSGTFYLNGLNANGTLTAGGSNTVTFFGVSGFSVENFVCTTSGRIINFTSGNTYNTNNLTLRGTAASPIQFKSLTSNVYTYFNLTTGGTCDVKFVTATDVDSSGGRLITNVKGNLTRTINWYKTNPDYFSLFYN